MEDFEAQYTDEPLIQEEITDVIEDEIVDEPQVKKYKVKVDGNEEEVDEDTLLKAYQKAKGSEKKFQEAAELRKQNEQLMKLLKENPRKLFEDPRIGVDFKKLAIDYLAEEMNNELLTPEEKEYRQKLKKLEEYEQREELTKKEQEAQQQKLLQEQYEEEFASTISDTIKSYDLPNTPQTIQKIAKYMLLGYEKGIELKPKQLANYVNNEIKSEAEKLLKNVDPETFEKMFGRDKLKQFGQHLVKTSNKSKPTVQQSSQTKSKQSQKMDLDTFFDDLSI